MEHADEVRVRKNYFSDFSIDTILQVTSKHSSISECERALNGFQEWNMEKSVEVAPYIKFESTYSFPRNSYHWLECNRFKPPRLHRKRERTRKQSGHRNTRIPFTGYQVSVLESKFQQTKYLRSTEVCEMSKKLQITESRVKIWFQNRRARERKESQSQSSPGYLHFGLWNATPLGSAPTLSTLLKLNLCSLYGWQSTTKEIKVPAILS